jgi:hypothetical protein
MTIVMKRFHYTLPYIIHVNGEIVPVHVMKTLAEDEWSTSRPGRFNLVKKLVPIYQETGWAPRAGLDGFGETLQYEMMKRVWEKWVLFLILRHPQKHPTPLLEIDPTHFAHNLISDPWLHHTLIDPRVTANR